MSRAGLNLIKRFEGCKLKAYLCPAGVLTIGWGFTRGVRRGDVITQAEADRRLVEEYDAFEREVRGLVRVPLTDNQWGALVSFTFNVGVANFKSSTLLKLLNQGKWMEAAEQFPRWNKAGGRVLAGLTTRRAAERQLFLTPSF